MPNQLLFGVLESQTPYLTLMWPVFYPLSYLSLSCIAVEHYSGMNNMAVLNLETTPNS